MNTELLRQRLIEEREKNSSLEADNDSALTEIMRLQRELAEARKALHKIADPEHAREICECDHTTDDCCVKMEEHCPQCIAGVAIGALSRD